MFKNGITFMGKKLTNKDIGLIAGALVMLIIYLVFNHLNTSAADEKKQMETRVAQARAAYNRTLQNSDVAALEEEKADLQSRTSMIFPSKEDEGELITLLWGWVEDSGLQITSGLTSVVSETVTLGEVQCRTNTVTVNVRGQAEQLTELLRRINESDITTTVVSNMSADHLPADWAISMKVIAYSEARLKTEKTTGTAG